MSMVDVPMFTLGYGSVSGNGLTTVLDAVDEKVGHCAFWVTPDGASRSITHVCFGVRSVAGSDSYTVQLESIDTETGYYNGVIASGASATPTISSAGWKEIELSTPYTMSSGTLAAVTITKTASNSNAIRITKTYNDWQSASESASMSYVVEDLGTLEKAYNRANCALKCSTGEYLIPFGGSCSTEETTISSTNSSNVYVGNKIVTPVAARIVGARLKISNTYDLYLKLLDSSGNVVTGDNGSAMSLSMLAALTGRASYWTGSVRFPDRATLSANTTYYLVMQSATSDSTTIYICDYYSTTLKNAAKKIPSTWTLSYVVGNSPSSLSVTDTRVADIYPVFDQIDIGSAGGGLPILGGSVVR